MAFELLLHSYHQRDMLAIVHSYAWTESVLNKDRQLRAPWQEVT